VQLCWAQRRLMTARYLCALILGSEVHGGRESFLRSIARCRNTYRLVARHFHAIMLAYNGWVAKHMLWPEF
jgi:hypothetical protein